jgi:hypothetical protein
MKVPEMELADLSKKQNKTTKNNLIGWMLRDWID